MDYIDYKKGKDMGEDDLQVRELPQLRALKEKSYDDSPDLSPYKSNKGTVGGLGSQNETSPDGSCYIY